LFDLCLKSTDLIINPNPLSKGLTDVHLFVCFV
jgi:hypothetical protein